MLDVIFKYGKAKLWASSQSEVSAFHHFCQWKLVIDKSKNINANMETWLIQVWPADLKFCNASVFASMETWLIQVWPADLKFCSASVFCYFRY